MSSNLHHFILLFRFILIDIFLCSLQDLKDGFYKNFAVKRKNFDRILLLFF